MLNGEDKMSLRFITPTSLHNIPTSIQIDWKLCDIISAEIFAFSHSCDTDWMSGHTDQYQNVEYNNIYHHTKFEQNRWMDVRMHANVTVFWQSVIWKLFPLFLLLFLCSHSGVLHFEWNLCVCDPFFKIQPQRELHSVFVDGARWVFLLLVFTCLEHECKDVLCPCDGMHDSID